jgi:hypothetical protein
MEVSNADCPADTFMVVDILEDPNEGEKEVPGTVTTLPLASTPKVAPADVGVVEFKFENFSPDESDPAPSAINRTHAVPL